jgi:alkanesulfonate monooxygenase SsuD/methylene tetrahydromethanopterin reductase-like flavin-dependent oxidoreductase (luciferase family)
MVDFGYSLPTFSEGANPEFIKEFSRTVEAEGFASLWIRDHLQLPDDTPFLDPLITHAAVSSVTAEVDLGTATLIPVRHPIVLAKLLFSLDAYADGRLTVGLGYGGLETDFDPVDIPFDRRQQAHIETIDILRGLSRESEFTYNGDLYSISDITLSPRPGDPLDIWLGGNSRHILERAGEEADGWIPYALPAEKLSRGIDLLRTEYDSDIPVSVVLPISVSKSGEIPDHTRTSIADRFDDAPENRGIIGSPEDCRGRLQEYIDAGVDQVIFDSRYDFENIHTHIELLMENVIDDLR